MATELLSLPTSERTNLALPERWASVLAGAVLTASGLARRTPLGLGLTLLGGALLYRGGTGHCPVYAALDIRPARSEPLRIARSVTVRRDRQEVYDFWRHLENLPRFMRHLEAVEELDERRSHWRARAPKGIASIDWDAEITEEQPGERIAWHSLPGAKVENAGQVEFREAPGGEGTEVHVEIEYRPPGGAAARLFNPALSQMVQEDIRRCKSLLETGEVPTIEGQPVGH